MSIENDEGAGGQSESEQEQGGELQGTSLLTKPDETAAQDASKQESGKEEAAGDQDGKREAGKDDPADKVPDKPDGYTLKFAEGTRVDPEMLTGFQQAAHEIGISQGKAQKLAAFYEAHVTKATEKVLAEQAKARAAQIKKWEGEIQGSPTFAQESDHARSALRQYGDKELFDLLDQTNLGSHPKMWAFLAKVGKALAEPGFKGKSVSRGEKTAAEILYPNQGKA